MRFFPTYMTPLLFTLVFFSFVAIIVVAAVVASVVKRRKEIDAYKAAIEKGIPLSDLKLARSPTTTLRAGFVWIAIGVGAFLIILFEAGGRGLSASAVPMLIGLALIVSYFVEKRAANEGEPHSD